MTDAYDALPYTEHAYAEAHPDNLEVVARLSGWPERKTGDAPRVLELGCGRGGNLLPMASAWPEGSFVGVDRSEVQIKAAAGIARAAGLTNLTLEAGDLTRIELPPSSFDYIICHGVYSWVDVSTRQAMLARLATWLAPLGIAYVSFNTLPGWYRRLAARDFLQLTARLRPDPHRDPREELAWLAEVVSREHDDYRRDLVAVGARLAEADRAYVTHEYLAEEHHPVQVTTFLSEACAAGLAYVGDATPAATLLDLSPEAVVARGGALAVPEREALVDFTRDTAFRRALLVRADAAARCGFVSPRRLRPPALATLRVASRLHASSDRDASDAGSFVGRDGSVQASGPLAVALHLLSETAPRSLPFVDLARQVGGGDELALDLIDLWLAGTGVDLHAREPVLCGAPSLRPEVCPVARWHAAHGGPITNRWHQEVMLREAVVRSVLAALDGTVSPASLAQRFRAEAPPLGEDEADALVAASLSLVARSALLVR